MGVKKFNVGVAMVAGFAGSFLMDVVQDGFATVFERNREANDRDEETEAIVAVVRRIAPLVPGGLARRYPGVVGRVIHYAFGSAFALAYAALRERRPQIAAANGAVFGAALWFISDAVLIPAAELGRPWFRHSPAQRANAVASHLTYGTTVEYLLRLTR